MIQFDSSTFTLSRTGSLQRIFLVSGVIGLALSVVAWFADSQHLYQSYLVAFAFWTTLALGMLFFTMLHHVTGAVWGLVIRRSSEAMMTVFPLLLLFFIPVVIGSHDLFHWTHEEAVREDFLLQWKAPYLNFTFFVVRGVLFFAVWIALAVFLNRYSLAQDTGADPGAARRMRYLSAAGIVLYAISSTFAAFDWLMSLEPHWYSTIFGVYIFVGGFLAALTFMTLFFLFLRSKGAMGNVVTREHYHDLGRMIFAFTVFWAYIAGSQYFLIWYANIPEETSWFLTRWNDGWKTVSLVIIIFHFAVPFVVLVFHSTKQNLKVLGTVAGILLVMHYVDMYWIVMPNFTENVQLSWMDLVTFVGIGGLVMWRFIIRYARSPLVPVKDPKLRQSIEHRV